MRIAFYKAFQSKATWIDMVIAMATFGKYSHVELVFSNGECFSISWRDKGGRFKNINVDNDRWVVHRLHVTYEEEAKIRLYCKQLTKKSYDFRGAFFAQVAILIKKCIHSKNKIFCSELSANSLRLYAEDYVKLLKGCFYTPNRLERFFRDV